MTFLAILIIAIFVANSAVAQDLLVKRTGEQMKVKVLKITKKKVEFVRHGTELPVYTLPVSDIDYIQYPMGDRDTFNKAESPKAKPTPQESTPANSTEADRKRWHGPVPPPDGSSLHKPVEPIAEGKKGDYSIGSIYNKDGVKGVVVMLYENGNHGLVMSLDEVCLAWCKLHRKKTKIVGANSKTDGMANMKAVERYIAANGLSWSDFPAFEWCRNKGEGWYLPSINELWSAGTMYLGGSRMAGSRRFRKNFNTGVIEAGGTPLSNIMFYHSSTEDAKDGQNSLYSHMNSEQPHIRSGYKADDLFVRAFYKF